MSIPEVTDTFAAYVRRVLTALGLAAAIVVLLFVIWRIGNALLVIFASGLFALLLSGCASVIHRKMRIPYNWSLLIVVLTLIVLIVGAFTTLGVQIAQQATQLYQGLQDSFQEGRDWVEQFGWGKQLVENAENGELQFSEYTAPAFRLLGQIFTAVTLVVMILVIGLYLAGRPNLYQQGFLRLIPIAKRDRVQEVLDAVAWALQGWLMAQFISMAVIGTLVSVGLWLFGIEMWLILGLLAGVLTFIPNLGPIIAGVPPVLIAFNQSAWMAAGVLGYFTVVQFLEGYFVTPMVQHRMIRLPPAAILSSQLLMAYAFGFLGVAVAAPLLAALMVVIEMLYVQDVLGDRDFRVTGQEAHLLSDAKPPSSE